MLCNSNQLGKILISDISFWLFSPCVTCHTCGRVGLDKTQPLTVTAFYIVRFMMFEIMIKTCILINCFRHVILLVSTVYLIVYVCMRF